MRFGLLALVAGAALPASVAVAQTDPVVPSRGPTITAGTPAPVIKAYDVSACARPGSRVVVLGNHFSPRGRRQVVLGGQGLHIDLDVARWQDASLVVTLPRDGRIRPGMHYFIGIEAGPHGPWVSNIDRPLLICGDARADPAAVDATPVPERDPPPGDPEPRDETDDSGARPSPTAVPGDARGGADDGNDAAANPFAGGPATSGSTPAAAPLLAPDTAPADPDDPDEMEPGQVLVWHPDIDAARAFDQQLAALGYTPRRRRVLRGLGVVQTTVGLPPGVPVAMALSRLLAVDPDLLADANHRYRPLAGAEDEAVLRLVGWSEPVTPCGPGGRVGIVDTVVDERHPAFAGRDLVLQSMLPAGVEVAPDRHGTAVGARLAALLPGTALRVAAVFRQREPDVVDTTAEWLVLALDWLLGEGAAAVNLSLGGPENRLLAAGVTRTVERGVGVVASVGDGGPQSGPVYPSAWPGVIGVTAIDRRRRVYQGARQGDEVDLAAPGVDVLATDTDGTSTYLTGTSYATPFVTAAWLLAGGGDALLDTAEDLGAPGRDTVFGAGLVRFDALCGDRGRDRGQ